MEPNCCFRALAQRLDAVVFWEESFQHTWNLKQNLWRSPVLRANSGKKYPLNDIDGGGWSHSIPTYQDTTTPLLFRSVLRIWADLRHKPSKTVTLSSPSYIVKVHMSWSSYVEVLKVRLVLWRCIKMRAELKMSSQSTENSSTSCLNHQCCWNERDARQTHGGKGQQVSVSASSLCSQWKQCINYG